MNDFLGAPIQHMTLRIQRDLADITELGDRIPRYIELYQPYGDLDLDLYAGDDNAIARIMGLVHEHFTSGFIGRALGKGQPCEYCGTVWLPGTFTCPSCGGSTRERDKVMEWERDGIITECSLISSVRDYTRIKIRARLQNVRNVDQYTRPAYFLIMRPGTWLCPWCGFYVIGGRGNCPCCGGNRLPINELAKLERMCVYCGKWTIGGWACPACNQRLTRK